MKTLFFICSLAFFSTMGFAMVKNPSCDCSFTGTVVDAVSGKPMPDVVIVAKGSIDNKEQKVITDRKGQFIIPTLPEGKYTLRFQKTNYRSLEKKSVVVKNNTSKLNVVLTLEKFNEEEEDYHGWLMKIDLL